MESLFYKGQDVVAIANHSKGYYVIGQEFKVLRITETRCKCKSVCIQIFPKDGNTYIGTCTGCGGNLGEDDFMYFNQEDFAPVQELGTMTYEDAIKWIQDRTLQIL